MYSDMGYIFHGLTEHDYLATYLAMQPPEDSALEFDDFAHSIKLTGMGVSPAL